MSIDRDALNRYKRVLVIKHGAFGDVIMAQGAMKDIRESFPNAEIQVLTEPAFVKIWNRCPFVDGAITDTREPRWRVALMLKLRAKLLAFDPDYVVDLQNSSRTAFYRSVLLPGPKWSFIKDAKKASSEFPKSMPSLERKYGQLKKSGLQHEHAKRPDIEWFANDVSKILEEAKVGSPLVTLVPGCSHDKRRWPYYAELAEALLANGYEVATVPGPDEVEAFSKIPGKTLTGGKFLDWFDLAGVLKASDFVIGNDTGPTHVASHLDRPGLALYGGHSSVAAASITARNLDAIDVPVLADLSVETVLQAVRERLPIS